MASRPLKLPGYKPISRPEDRHQPFAGGGAPARKEAKAGSGARALSRQRRPGSAVPPSRAVADAVTAREAALRRLRKVADGYAEAQRSVHEVRRDLIDGLLHLRVLSLETVEAIEQWRSSTNRPSAVWPDPATGENYLLKMKEDTRYLADHAVGEILNFSTKHDPFFVVPSAKENHHAAPTNQMTPMLQARRQQGDGRKAVLPLQASLLRRIHKAELVILKEAVQARLQRSACQSPAETPQRAGFMPPSSFSAKPMTPSSAPSEGLAGSPTPARQSAPEVALLQQSLAAQGAKQLVGVDEPGDGVFVVRPVDLSKGSIIGSFQKYIARVERRLAATMEPLQALEQALEDEGSGAPEWFWLYRRGRSTSEEPDGLFVFRLKRASTNVGQLLHVSVVDLATLEDALEAIKAHIFNWLPVSGIRVTLWYWQSEDGYQLDKEIQGIFKKGLYKWNQLLNSADGTRGQVMRRPRGEPPIDPEQPQELHCISICVGQAWLRGCKGVAPAGQASGECPRSLVLASVCLRQFLKRDESEARSAMEAVIAPCREAAREGLMRGLETGELDSLLASLVPAGLDTGGSTVDSARGGAPASLVKRLTQSLEASGAGVPGIFCEMAKDVSETVRRDTSGGAFAQAVSALGVESLPSSLAQMCPQDAAFGRLFVTLDWQGITKLNNGGGFEVPVLQVGSCQQHPHPVVYVGTSEEDTFIVIIPWETVQVPRDGEDTFAACTEILRNTKPMETPPFKAVQLPSFEVRSAAQTTQIKAAAALGLGGGSALHVAEFSSVSVCAGRDMPGRLWETATNGHSAARVVRRPFAFCVWHTDIDELNVPLAATMVA